MQGGWVVAIAIAGALVAAPTKASAHRATTGPTPSAERLLVDGENALEAQDWSLAADKFRQAYNALSESDRSGDLGAHVLTQAVTAYGGAYRSTGQARHLERCVDLLQSVAAAHGGTLPTVELRAELEGFEALLERLNEGDSTENTASPPQDGSDRATDPPPDRQRRKPDAPGIALVVVGGAVFGAGVGLTVWGALLPASSQEALDQREGTSPEDDAFLERARRIGLGSVIGGSIAMAVGLGGVAWGAVRLARHARRGRRTAVEPMLSPSFVGLRLKASF